MAPCPGAVQRLEEGIGFVERDPGQGSAQTSSNAMELMDCVALPLSAVSMRIASNAFRCRCLTEVETGRQPTCIES